MKKLLFILLIAVEITNAQNQLNRASVSIKKSGKGFQIEQKFEVNLMDTLKNFEVKALKFDSSEIHNISIKSVEDIKYEKLSTEGLDHLKLFLGENKASKYIIEYEVRKYDNSLNIPLFFPDLPAASSENDFFQVDIKLPSKQNYALHFPSVETKEEVMDEIKIITFELPAITSLIRIELLKEGSEASNFIAYVDASVAILFVIIGFLIWKNRKRLIYG